MEVKEKNIEGMGARDAWVGDLVGEICVMSVEPLFPCFDRFCTPLTIFVIYSVGPNNVALTCIEHCCKHMHRNSSARIPYICVY